MGSVLYAVATKATSKLEFRPAEPADLAALEAAERELNKLRRQWDREGTIPAEDFPTVCSDERPRLYGMPRWADLFAPRQLLALGVLVEELRSLRPRFCAPRAQSRRSGGAPARPCPGQIRRLHQHAQYLGVYDRRREAHIPAPRLLLQGDIL